MGHFISEQLSSYAERVPDRAALNINDEYVLTYSTWEQMSNFAAQRLEEQGLQPGQRVGLLYGGTNWSEYAVAYMGVIKAGGTCLNLPTAEDDEEMLRRMDQCGVVGVIHGHERDLPQGRPDVWMMHVPCGKLPIGAVTRRVGPEGAAEIIYSSGTTGKATAVIVPDGNLTIPSAIKDMVAVEAAKPMVGSVRLGLHASSTVLGMILQSKPSSVVMAPPDDVERMAELIAKYQAEMVMVTPYQAARLEADHVGDRHDLTSVQIWGSASAFMNGRLAGRLMELSPGSRVLNAYSASEARPALLTAQVDPTHPDVLGLPGASTAVLVTDEEGVALPPKVTGQIWLSAKGAAMRIPLTPEAAAEAKMVPGFIPTGDLGWVDDDGTVHLFDRAADVIHGLHGMVSTLKVENTIQGADGVAEVAAVGFPLDDQGHEVPVACVRLLDGTVVSPEFMHRLAEQVAELAAAELAPCERPAALVLVSTIPRNQLGKPCKPTIKRMLLDAHGSVLAQTSLDRYELLDIAPAPYVTDVLLQPTAA